MFDAFAVALEGGGTVATLDGAIQLRVGFDEARWHGERVVEVGQGGHPIRRQLESAGVEDGLGGGFDGGLLRVGRRGPGEVVIDDAGGISKSRF